MHIDIGPAMSPHPHQQHHHQPPPHSSASASASAMSVLTSPTSTTTSPSERSPGAALVSPLTRRATDLSVLLNSDPPALDTPLFTPTTPRGPATLSHLLLPESDDSHEVEQLSHSTPLRRRSSASTSASESASSSGRSTHFPATPLDFDRRIRVHASPAARPTTLPAPFDGLIATYSHGTAPTTASTAPTSVATNRTAVLAWPRARHTVSHTRTCAASSPATQKQPPSPPPRQRPNSRSEASQQRKESTASLPPSTHPLPPKPMPPPPSAFKRSPIPYAPRKRISPAASKRVEDLLGDGEDTAKREREDDPASEESPRKKRRTGDVAVVVEHYNARPDVGVAQRQESPIIGLKNFNNWVKSVLITRFAHPALAASPSRDGPRGRMRGRVLDMGCGKGGDLTKWAKANVAEYVGLDIAAVSIEQAQKRHATSRGSRFVAEFYALDCYSHVLSEVLPPWLLQTPFDVVSMQFCMHYAFESETKARIMLQNVATWLRPGGVFVGTIPNAKQLMEQLDALPPDTQDLSWGNKVYRIRFEDRRNRPIFGHRYWFYLKDAVDDVPEYVVHWENFVQLAAEYGLHPNYKKEFHDIFDEHHEHEEFGELLQRMRVVDAVGESQMDEDQVGSCQCPYPPPPPPPHVSSCLTSAESDASHTDVYIGFAFEKR
ncbi:hypothetical protein BN946_scf185004.g20 [Trametes cinnabarina]|uniref:mRNA cap guanine-N(7) methyltransferase n=1 Tax=Pycnoporus cinnabarinus TaxID=5643 RepID=A0A060SKI1_PYCCI|nr:hypothetical protein BN946_scf185004.g20 [Trametes cinnabarina]